MKLTKNDMARVIITALYVMPALAPADHRLVVKLARRKASWLVPQHERAVRVLDARAASIRAGTLSIIGGER